MNFLKCSFNGPLATANLNTEQTSFLFLAATYLSTAPLFSVHYFFYYVHFKVKIHIAFFHQGKEHDKVFKYRTTCTVAVLSI